MAFPCIITGMKLSEPLKVRISGSKHERSMFALNISIFADIPTDGIRSNSGSKDARL